MRHGYHMGIGFYGAYIFIFLLLIISALIFSAHKNQSSANPLIIKLINILKENYASGILTADEFIERKAIIEDAEYSNSYTPVLLERYAGCLINTEEFIKIKDEIESNKYDSFICEQLAYGELSYGEIKYKKIGGQTNEKE